MVPVLPLLAIHHATEPVVGTFHTHFRPGVFFRLARGLLQRYLDRLDAAIAVSRACLAPLDGRLRADFRIVPNGVDTEWFARGRRLPGFDDGRLNVLWVGRVEPRNGLDRMLADRKVRSNDLARAIGITPSNLSLLKSGKVKGIKFETLDAICEVLGCQPGDILEHAPNGRAAGPEVEEPGVLRRAG